MQCGFWLAMGWLNTHGSNKSNSHQSCYCHCASRPMGNLIWMWSYDTCLHPNFISLIQWQHPACPYFPFWFQTWTEYFLQNLSFPLKLGIIMVSKQQKTTYSFIVRKICSMFNQGKSEKQSLRYVWIMKRKYGRAFISPLAISECVQSIYIARDKNIVKHSIFL